MKIHRVIFIPIFLLFLIGNSIIALGAENKYGNCSFEYLYNDGSGYKLQYKYARNGAASLQQSYDEKGVASGGTYIELTTGVTITYDIKSGTGVKRTENNNKNFNLLDSIGVFGTDIGAGYGIWKRVGGETLEGNYCDIQELRIDPHKQTYTRIWLSKEWKVKIKDEGYNNNKLTQGRYLKNFQVGTCTDDSAALPKGLKIIDVDALEEEAKKR